MNTNTTVRPHSKLVVKPFKPMQPSIYIYTNPHPSLRYMQNYLSKMPNSNFTHHLNENLAIRYYI